MFIQKLLYGSLAIGAGIILLKYNFQVVNNFTGRLDFVEAKLGAGSTYLVYKLLALLLVLGGILYIAGYFDNVVGWLLSPLTGLFQLGS